MSEATQTTVTPEAPITDPFDPNLKGLGKLYKGLVKASTAPKDANDKPPLDALKVPADVADRRRLSERIRQLFQASINRSFTVPQLERVLAVCDQIMPPPDAPNFAEALQNRCHGVLKALFFIASYRAERKDANDNAQVRETVVVEIEQIGAPVMDPDMGIPVPLREAKPLVYNANMHQRIEWIEGKCNEVQELPQIKAENGKLYPLVSLKYKNLLAAFTALIQAYRKKIDQFAATHSTPEYAKAQWMNALLSNLNAFDEKRPDAAQKLAELAEALAGAKDVEAFKNAISNFGQEAPAPAAASAVSPAVAPVA